MSINESDVSDFNKSYTIDEDINGPVFAAAFAVELVLSFVPNLFIVVYTFYNYKVLKQPSMIFLTGLAMSNLLLTVLFMPFTIITAAAGEWIFGRTDEERDGMCEFVGFIFAYGVALVIHTIALISLDRFLLIVKPLFYRHHMKTVTGVILLGLVWTYSFIIITPISHGLGSYDLSTYTASCIPIWVGHRTFVIYALALSTIPFTIIFVTSVWTFCFTHKLIKRHKRRQQSSSVPSLANIHVHTAEEDNIYTKRVQKLFGLFGSLLVVCVVTSSSFMTCTITGLFIGFDMIPVQVYVTAFIIFFTGNIANAIIQSCFRRDLKEAVYSGLNKIQCSCITMSQE